MSDWNFTDYGTNADRVFAAMPKYLGLPGVPDDKSFNAAVIAFGKNGDTPVAKQYKTSAEASAAYDAVVNSPTDRWYVSLYDTAKSATPNGRVDETYFGGVNSVEVKEKVVTRIKEVIKRNPTKGAAIGVIGAFGLLALIAKAK